MVSSPRAGPPRHGLTRLTALASIDVSGTDKESVTPSEVPELSNERSLGVHNTKRTKWSMDEEIHLTKAWINISTNPIISNDQKEQTFWKRSADYYKYRADEFVEQPWVKVKSHFYKLHLMVNEFTAIYNNFYTYRESGWTDENVLKRAYKMWQENHCNKSINYEHV
ncbi:glutathione S-transferase T3-like [Zingiber officinale]|uniref:glutathione S-transferase T3-like n=1 Tax=Zingiber officinale TaxID=94328 RepID=UPI001C4B4A81|nr:glutathione S-transferase T3-like [Zingiber officinale]